MGSPTPSHLMIPLTIFIVLNFNSSMVTATSPLMQSICLSTATISQKTINYDDCIDALNINPWSARANLIGLAHIALNLGKSNTTDGKKFIQNLIRSKQTDPSLVKPLKNCLSSYDAAKNSFRSAVMKVGEDALAANYDAKIAGHDADECAKGLSSMKAHIPSVTARNTYIKLYSYIGVAITDRLN